MNKSYEILQDIHERYLSKSIQKEEFIKIILNLLSEQVFKGSQPFRNDGVLEQITLSIPTIITNTYVIGLRFRKLREKLLYAENHYVCAKNEVNPEIKYYSKITWEEKCPEYKDTHHVYDLPMPTSIDYNNHTYVSTISYLVDTK